MSIMCQPMAGTTNRPVATSLRRVASRRGACLACAIADADQRHLWMFGIRCRPSMHQEDLIGEHLVGVRKGGNILAHD